MDVENAGRSQMAEAFFREYAPEKFQAISAGTKPSEQVNPIVAQVMQEVGINIEKNIPKSISKEMIHDSTQAFQQKQKEFFSYYKINHFSAFTTRLKIFLPLIFSPSM